MLDQLFNLVKQFSGNAVVNNPEVPNEKNNEVVAEATNTIAGGLQNMLSGGGLKDILSMFQGGGNNAGGGSSSGISGLMKNPIVSMMIGHFISKLTGKFGLKSSQASNIANDVIPSALSGLITKTNDPNDNSFDLNSLIGSLTGGNAPVASSGAAAGGGGGFDLNSLIGKITGDKDGDGDTDIQDIIKSVTGGAQKQQESQAQSGGGGGIMDMLKGLIG